MTRALLAWSASAALAAGFAVACGTPPVGEAPGALTAADVAAAQARWPDATAEGLEGGRKLFLARCQTCHGYPDVQKIAEQSWPGIMDRMAQQAHLTAAEKEAILRFILTEREARVAASPK